MKLKDIVRMNKHGQTMDIFTTIYDVHSGSHADIGYIVVDNGTMTVYRPHGSSVWYVASGHVVPFRQLPEKKDR